MERTLDASAWDELTGSIDPAETGLIQKIEEAVNKTSSWGEKVTLDILDTEMEEFNNAMMEEFGESYEDYIAELKDPDTDSYA